MQYLDSHAKIDALVENVAAIRSALGKDFGIAVDFHGRVHRPMVKPLFRALEPLSADASSKSRSSVNISRPSETSLLNPAFR